MAKRYNKKKPNNTKKQSNDLTADLKGFVNLAPRRERKSIRLELCIVSNLILLCQLVPVKLLMPFDKRMFIQ